MSKDFFFFFFFVCDFFSIFMLCILMNNKDLFDLI